MIQPDYYQLGATFMAPILKQVAFADSITMNVETGKVLALEVNHNEVAKEASNDVNS